MNNVLEKYIISKYPEGTKLIDLIGDKEPSLLFYLLGDVYSYLLSNETEKVLSKESIERRKQINKIIKTIGKYFLSSNQIIEDKNKLDKNNSYEELIISDEPIIWAPNHGFKDDALATVLAIPRNAYIMFGSLPQFYNTLDGIISWLNGVILINRKNTESRKLTIDKAKHAIDLGTDLIWYPEGVWCKSPNLLSLELWPGVFKVAKEKGIKIVPVIHYKKKPHLMTKDDTIHTVIDNPISLENMTIEEAQSYLRDRYAYWTWLMMEKYGKTTRKEELGDFKTSDSAWENRLKARIETADRYDLSIETTADYRRKEVREFYETLADLNKNYPSGNFAGKMLKKDFQRRF